MSARGSCRACPLSVPGTLARLLWSFSCTMCGKGVSTKWLTMWSGIVSSDCLVFCLSSTLECARMERGQAPREVIY